ncbi:zinc ribbon domain-containing protein [Chloracidobacterium aggregatum]|uniref:zinc ribbon domain-containing protein n=1 Tax=Chloracidobacterium aggregatum TaxID=2851959 RepID=UPI001B8A8E69|nr:zinc ribbon domain-containing protein [Chloracidobacterium aggregatum]QUV84208.1 zinc ribbon domain-containing protein [Chloracidobacterium sp. 2]QUV90211.1 zinc ribbon domain-containing protein [Chloracidobacterium sp. A]QUV96578.1 zinc ribbon domain-containing protein [Chloracidobacterium sp. E]
MLEADVTSGGGGAAGHPYGGWCPNCGAPLAVGQKYCIRCGLRYDAVAFERLAALEAERRAILMSLLPTEASAAKAGSAPGRPVPPVQMETALAETEPEAGWPSDADTGSVAWLLPVLVYGGGMLMVIGALVYLRGIILEYPAVQLGLVTAAMAGFFGLAVRGLHHDPDNLLARGWLWLAMLLLPLNFWLGVRHGWLPSGVGWAYALACAVAYWSLATWLADRAVPHLAVCVGLVAVLWFGVDVLPSEAAACGLLSVVAMGLAVWSVRFPAHIAATAGWWWGAATVGLCALATPSLGEPWLGSLTGLSCLVLGGVTASQGAAWGWVGGGLGVLTLAYGQWLALHNLPSGWLATGWAGWLWVLTLGQIAADRRAETDHEEQARRFSVPCRWAGHLLAGVLGLWALLGVVIGFDIWLFATSAGITLGRGLATAHECVGYGLAWALVAGWGAWQMRKTLLWFPLCLAVVSILAISSALTMGAREIQVISGPMALLVLPVVLCATRFGIEWLGAWLGREYSTEVDTSFGLDFGLPHHPAIVPSRWVVDFCAVVHLLGLVVLAAEAWHPVHTVGIAILALYGGLGWFLSSTPGLQRGYALALWGVAYVGLVVTGCGAGQVGWLDILPWVALVAGGSVVVVSAPVVDESHLRAALRQVSLVVLGWGVPSALVGIVTATGPEAGHFLALASAAGAGWVAAVRQVVPLWGLLATVCGGLAAVQAARLAGCPMEALPMVGVVYGYSAAWLGWRRPQRAKEGEAEPSLWGSLNAGGQLCLWVGAVGALGVLEGQSAVLVGCSLVCAASALAVASFLARDATHDLYAVAALVWGAVTYVWALSYLVLPPFERVAALTVPYGVVVAGVGWLKWRWQRGHPVLARLLIWLGSFVFCFPVVVQSILLRLDGKGAPGQDMLADATALTALVLGLSTRWKAPAFAGGTALGLHLSVVLAVSVPWGDVPYGVYLALVGLTLFVTGIWLWRRYQTD